jgi:hypothetical protein
LNQPFVYVTEEVPSLLFVVAIIALFVFETKTVSLKRNVYPLVPAVALELLRRNVCEVMFSSVGNVSPRWVGGNVVVAGGGFVVEAAFKGRDWRSRACGSG